MSDNDNRVTYFAETDYRNQRTPFGIRAADRARHMYVIGKTGMGKSTMLENMAVQDIQNGEGMAFIDPHGAAVEKLLSYVPEHRVDDVLYFAPFDMQHPIAFNIMEDVGYDRRHLVANGLMSAFKKIWADQWSARMEYILNNAILALLEYPETTLLSINRMLVDKKYRDKIVANITDPSVKAFWTEEFAKYSDRYAQDATPAIQNKIGQFTSNPIIRNIIGQPYSSFDLRKFMDEKKIILMNLSKGQMGEQNANLLGSMLVTKIYLAAMSRADLPAETLAGLPNFYFYVDEFQSFANESFSDILSEARKYKLNFTIAHQYVEQMPEEVRAAVFGNVGTIVSFRVGSYDAEIFEKEFMPRFAAQDIVNLGFSQIYLRLMIGGVGSQPFSAVTMPPIAPPEQSFMGAVLSRSREQFAAPREVVEDGIETWHKTAAEQLEKPQRKVAQAKGEEGQKQTDHTQDSNQGQQNAHPPQGAPQNASHGAPAWQQNPYVPFDGRYYYTPQGPVPAGAFGGPPQQPPQQPWNQEQPQPPHAAHNAPEQQVPASSFYPPYKHAAETQSQVQNQNQDPRSEPSTAQKQAEGEYVRAESVPEKRLSLDELGKDDSKNKKNNKKKGKKDPRGQKKREPQKQNEQRTRKNDSLKDALASALAEGGEASKDAQRSSGQGTQPSQTHKEKHSEKENQHGKKSHHSGEKKNTNNINPKQQAPSSTEKGSDERASGEQESQRSKPQADKGSSRRIEPGGQQHGELSHDILKRILEVEETEKNSDAFQDRKKDHQ